MSKVPEIYKLIKQPKKTIMVLSITIFLTIVFAYISWMQGHYAVYTVFVFGAGFCSFGLGLSLDSLDNKSQNTHEKRSQEYTGERKP